MSQMTATAIILLIVAIAINDGSPEASAFILFMTVVIALRILPGVYRFVRDLVIWLGDLFLGTASTINWTIRGLARVPMLAWAGVSFLIAAAFIGSGLFGPDELGADRSEDSTRSSLLIGLGFLVCSLVLVGAKLHYAIVNGIVFVVNTAVQFLNEADGVISLDAGTIVLFYVLHLLFQFVYSTSILVRTTIDEGFGAGLGRSWKHFGWLAISFLAYGAYSTTLYGPPTP
ncbi:MAG: hypothetical protein GC152_03360 [Alphaproteobacteria bacterium]|nr:hypothetical protein [Alphaproteobacteria bacterium]